MRINKFIAECGVCSRRKADELILSGVVAVNGEPLRELGLVIDPAADVVTVEGETLHWDPSDKIYLLLNKPRGVMTTVADPEGRETVMDFIPKLEQRVYPVGRLDYLSEGLIILTNDGELTHEVLHPSKEVEKVYEVKVFGIVSESLLKSLRKGVHAGGDLLKPESVRILKFLKGKTWLEIRLKEGKNREIRRLCEALDLVVDKLKRVAIGGLHVQGIAPGSFVFQNKKQIRKLIWSQNEKHRFQSPKKSVSLARRRKMRLSEKTASNDPSYKKFGEIIESQREKNRRKGGAAGPRANSR